MGGVSWRGDPAQTRRHAFERLQQACTASERADADLATAEKDAEKLRRDVEKALADASGARALFWSPRNSRRCASVTMVAADHLASQIERAMEAERG